MVSTCALCPAERLQRRGDLVIRPVPEIGLCMVYRPGPARIVTLNPSAWLLLQACNGETVEQIEAAFAAARSGKGRALAPQEVRQGLQSLVDLALVRSAQHPKVD
jgi:hypothetical protein